MTNHQQTSNTESLRTIKANEQRLKSLDEYERETQNKRRLIKDSLNNQINATHVKFDSDDDGDECQKPKPFKIEKLQLFDDNSELNVDEHFTDNKNRRKKQKLQHLQTRTTMTNDPRFQLSEKFLDEHEKIDDDEDENTDHNQTMDSTAEISLEDEKKKSLAILDQITKSKPRPSVEKPKTKMIRFDPSKTEHKIYEIGSEVVTNGNKRENSDDVQLKSILKRNSEPKPVLDMKRSYEFDESKLKSMFNKTANVPTNSNFQFQFFTNAEPAAVPLPQSIPLPKRTANGKSKMLFNKPDDTSSEEDDDEQPAATESEENKKPVRKEIESKTFFFFDIDERLKDGLESFQRTEDIEELERTWPTKRKEIAEALRTKHRKALLRKDRKRVFNHRHRQKQHESAKSSSQ